jgi:hypothetical protein
MPAQACALPLPPETSARSSRGSTESSPTRGRKDRAALYRRVTRRVADGIAGGRFDDGARMDRLDTNFANRYFAALTRRLARADAPRAWTTAFVATDASSAIVLQHLLLAMNAHINVDLGAAAAATCPGPALARVRADFDRINALLAELVDEVQSQLGDVSPLLGAVDAVGGRSDERLAIFSMDAARADAWRLATALDEAPRLLRGSVEWLADERAAALGRLIADPPGPARALVDRVAAAEEKDVRVVLEVLAGETSRSSSPPPARTKPARRRRRTPRKR